ncbi:MAG: hypothetical protein ACFE8M_09200 [Candidatus Hermodarchaeota archaeon]
MAIKEFKSKLEELEAKKREIKPKIEEIEASRQEELAEINKKYDHMVDDVKEGVKLLENNLMNYIIDTFEKVVMNEFDIKRSTSEYTVTDDFKDFREAASEIEIFPKDLVERLDKVINGAPIDNIAYDLEKIKNMYKKE